jgi:hypothetical protein
MQQAWTAFCAGAREGKDQKLLLDSLGLSRYCCRRMILTQPLPLRIEASAVVAEPGGEASKEAPAAAPKRKAARRS